MLRISIRITLMRIRIRLTILMRMRIMIFIWCRFGCGYGFLFDADADPDPTFHPDADTHPSFQIKSWKSAQIDSYSIGTLWLFICTLMRIRISWFLFDADPDAHLCCGCGSRLSKWCRSMRIRIHKNVLAHPLMSFTKYGTWSRSFSFSTQLQHSCSFYSGCTIHPFFYQTNPPPPPRFWIMPRRFTNGSRRLMSFLKQCWR